MNQLDRILLDLESPDPSPGFTSGVMSAVRQDTDLPTSSSPLWLLGLGVLLMAVLALLVVSARGVDLTPSTSPGLAGKALWGALVIVGTTVAAILPLQLFDN